MHQTVLCMKLALLRKNYDRSDPESSTEFEREVARKLTGFLHRNLREIITLMLYAESLIYRWME